MSKDGGRGVKVMNNYDWMRDVSFLDFLRMMGKMVRVFIMFFWDSVKN